MVSDYPLSCVRELPMLHPAGRRTELLVLLPTLEFAVAMGAFKETGRRPCPFGPFLPFYALQRHV